MTVRRPVRGAHHEPEVSLFSIATLSSAVAGLAGLWLLLSPLLLDHWEQSNAAWNDVIVGGALVVLAIVLVRAPIRTAPVSWFVMFLGLWLVIFAFAAQHDEVDDDTVIVVNEIVVGAIVFVAGTVSALAGMSALPARRRAEEIDDDGAWDLDD